MAELTPEQMRAAERAEHAHDQHAAFIEAMNATIIKDAGAASRSLIGLVTGSLTRFGILGKARA